MKKLVIPLLLVALALSACGEQGAWEMPQVDAAPTQPPVTAPVYSTSSPVNYIWNEAVAFNMSDPGVTGERIEQELSHSASLSLFPSDLLPEAIFTESRSPYNPLRLQKVKHSVLVDAQGGLAEHAYVEYQYLPKNGNEKRGITVMAELCSHDALLEIYQRQLYPHASFAQDIKPRTSSYYLEHFMLIKVGELRYAQALVLPDAYFSKVSSLEAALEDGQELSLPRQALLNFTCGEDISDEQFIDAVCRIWQYGAGTDPIPPVETPKIPVMGEKGAA